MVDRYTKIVLTVIAACLVWLSVRDAAILRTSQAQDVAHVIVDNKTPVPVIIGYQGEVNGSPANLVVTEKRGLPVAIVTPH